LKSNLGLLPVMAGTMSNMVAGRVQQRRCKSVLATSALVACLLLGCTSAVSLFVGGLPPSRQIERRPLMPRRATATASSTEDDCTASGRSASELADDMRELLTDVANITMSVGFQTGTQRALQAGVAVAQTLAEVAREPPSTLDEAFAAKVLRQLFERLGATYIKLGQFIASSPTVFPAVYVKEFQRCLDNTGSVPFEEVKRIIEDDLGRRLYDVFSYVDPQPLAAASIAQVHPARLLSGEEVVIKVQKPDIEEVLQTDLSFVYIGARLLNFLNPDLNVRGSLLDVVTDLRTSMLGELDFRKELDNLEVFRQFLTDNGLDGIATAPKPYALASSKKVLTMERLNGVPLVDLDGIRDLTDDPEASLVAALNVWVLSVQKCEFFHADVHAGNLLVLDGGKVGFLDFGIVGRLPPKMASAIDKLNAALASADSRGMADALVDMGATVGTVDREAFAEDINELLQKISTDGEENLSVDESQIQDVVLDIAQVAGNNGLKLPREFGLLIKQSLYFDRYTKLLAPDLDMMSDSRIARFGAESNDDSPGNSTTETE